MPSGLSRSWLSPCLGLDMVPTPVTGPARHLRLLLTFLLPFLAFLCHTIRLLHRCRLTCTCLPKTTHQNEPYILRIVATPKHSMEELHIVHAEELYTGSICSQVPCSTGGSSHSNKALSLRRRLMLDQLAAFFVSLGRVGWTKRRTAPIRK